MNSREKIHEFVNMARHPEAKDLAEALEIDTIEYENSYCFDKTRNTICLYHPVKNIIKKEQLLLLGRPITAFDVCWALNKKTAEFNFSVDTRGISFSRFCKMEADGNLVSCMPSLQGLKRGKGNIPFKTIEEDGTHTILYQWGSKIHNNLAILMYSNKDIIEIAKFKPKVN